MSEDEQQEDVNNDELEPVSSAMGVLMHWLTRRAFWLTGRRAN